MTSLRDFAYDAASMTLTVGLLTGALVVIVVMCAAVNHNRNRTSAALMVVSILMSGTALVSWSAAAEKRQDELSGWAHDWRSQRADQEAEQAAEMDAIWAEHDEWFEREMTDHAQKMKRINAKLDRLVAREAVRRGVPAETIDPRIPGNMERWNGEKSS